jgi:hypothetical protein
VIIDPGFPDHWKVRELNRLSESRDAVSWMLRLWGECQRRRSQRFQSGLQIARICGFEGDPEEFIGWLTQLHWIEKSCEEYVALSWDEYNSSLIANWENGRLGGRPKKTQHKPIETHGYPMANPLITQAKPIEKRREDKIEEKTQRPTRKLAADALLIPLPLFLESKEFRTALSHWVDHKKLKRDPLTQHALDLIVKDCEKWGADQAIKNIEYSIKRGWKGVFQTDNPPRNNGLTPAQKPEPTFVTREKVEDWCFRKKVSKMTDRAWGEFVGGKRFGVVIETEDDFNGVMEVIKAKWEKE